MLETSVLRVGEASLACHALGNGRVALFIHGFPLDHRMWLDQLIALSRHRRCVAVDLRGHGASPWVGDAVHSPELLADDLAAVIEAITLEGADVVALSMGGYVALALAERRPELVRTLTLIDTRSGSDTDQTRTGRDTMAEVAATEGTGRVAADMIPRLVAAGAGVLVRARLRTMIEETPAETMVADLRGMRDRPDRTQVLATLEAPLAVLVGEHDAITPPEEAAAMAESGGVTARVIPGAGHMSPMEHPEAVNRWVLEHWLRS
ncbi:MAG: alpha/beta fold hydrolase [Acidimicrobiia bacterium]